MNFFQVVSIVMGLVSISARLLIHLVPESWNRFELEAVYKTEKPRWIGPLAIASSVLIVYTWYKQITTDIPYSIILTLLLTLTLLKTFQLVFNYDSFRKFVHKVLVEDRSILVKINIFAFLMGVALLYLGVFVY